MRLRLILLLAFAVAGCTDDRQTRVVDFSRTIEVARPIAASPEQGLLRVAVGAMVSPRETFVHYREILEYIGAKVGKEVELIQRKTYGEINDLLGNGEIDLAFVCSGPYALEREKHGFVLLAAPEVNGSHFDQAYLIVNAHSPVMSLEDLRGKTFAFTDPDSNTGKLVPTHLLASMHETPESFFRETVYTYSHDNAIMAVGKGLVDGACVDGLIWEFYHKRNPSVTAATRVIRKSEPYGIPPLVASAKLSDDIKRHIQQLFYAMHLDANGKRILDQLMIDRFVEPYDEWYDSIRALIVKSDSRPGDSRGPQDSSK
jgi:phosphonate transport system substrate-binding protein